MVFEIGSEFEFDYESIMSADPKELEHLFNYSKYMLVSSGRCGIKQVLLNLINENDPRDEFLLPSYLCPSIVQPFRELNLKINYYNINPNLSIDLDDLNSKLNNRTKAVYFINYFGILQPNEVLTFLETLKSRNIQLIEDITHNFFSKRADIGDYLIGSLRKWGPLPHGGLVIVKRDNLEYKTWYENSNLSLKIGQLRAFGQQLKSLYLDCLRNEDVKNVYLQILREMDKALYSHIEIVPMDQLSVNILKRIDFEEISKKRKENYRYLYEHLRNYKEVNILIGDIGNNVTPLGFHILIENRDNLREYLVKHGVYASIHWGLPQEVQENFKGSTNLSKRILTIPCDQRYDEKEMKYIVELMQTYFVKMKNSSFIYSK